MQAVLAIHHEKRFEACGPPIGDFCHSVLRACTAKETVHAALLVEFLKAALPLLPPAVITSVCEAIMRLLTLAVVRVLPFPVGCCWSRLGL